MKFLKKMATAAAAVAMAASPVAVSANPAASLSLAGAARTGGSTAGDSHIAEGPTATLINIGILAALVVVVLVATGGDDDSDSN